MVLNLLWPDDPKPATPAAAPATPPNSSSAPVPAVPTPAIPVPASTGSDPPTT